MDKHVFQKTVYEKVALDTWRVLKAELFKMFKLEIRQDQAKIQWGSTVYDWDTGIMEWDYRIDPDARPEVGTLEIRIKRRPADPPILAVEQKIAEVLKNGKK